MWPSQHETSNAGNPARAPGARTGVSASRHGFTAQSAMASGNANASADLEPRAMRYTERAFASTGSHGAPAIPRANHDAGQHQTSLESSPKPASNSPSSGSHSRSNSRPAPSNTRNRPRCLGTKFSAWIGGSHLPIAGSVRTHVHTPCSTSATREPSLLIAIAVATEPCTILSARRRKPSASNPGNSAAGSGSGGSEKSLDGGAAQRLWFGFTPQTVTRFFSCVKPGAGSRKQSQPNASCFPSALAAMRAAR